MKLKKIFSLNKVAYQQIGCYLTRLSKAMGYEKHEIEDEEYDHVGTYHIDVINKFKENLANDTSVLNKYRLAA